MDSIRIGSTIKRVAINDDPARVIEFNPSDIVFAERFYTVYGEFMAKLNEYQQKAASLDETKRAVDENGIPTNLNEGISFLREVCGYMRGRIDYLFGEGTSQKAFGDALSFEMICEFLDGISPFIEAARSDKMQKYAAKSGRVMK